MKNIEYKIRHKEEGWTGTLTFYIEEFYPKYWGSHRTGGDVRIEIKQDTEDQDGNYVEDPKVDSLDELEIIS